MRLTRLYFHAFMMGFLVCDLLDHALSDSYSWTLFHIWMHLLSFLCNVGGAWLALYFPRQAIDKALAQGEGEKLGIGM